MNLKFGGHTQPHFLMQHSKWMEMNDHILNYTTICFIHSKFLFIRFSIEIIAADYLMPITQNVMLLQIHLRS